jgi:hypothetical protein
MIQRIEELGAELHSAVLSESRDLRDRQVEVVCTRTVDDVLTRVSIREGRRCDESSRFVFEPPATGMCPTASPVS